jgi:hypothetical protein
MSQRESKLVRNTLNDIAPNNSNKGAQGSKKGEEEVEDKRKLKPLVKKGSVAKKKRTVMDKFKDSFLGESENLKEYVLYDVLVPAFRDTVSDMGFGIIERLFGNGRSGGGRSRDSRIVRDRGKSYVSYAGVQNDNRRDKRDFDNNSRARHNFENVVFTNKWEAEDVLAHLADLIVEYGEATVREFYELSNIESDYTDEKYGWLSLRDAYVDRTRDGHVIMFPPTRPL